MMLIKDFIKSLEAYNPNADITLTTSEDITLSYISKDINGEELSKETTMQVFIESTDSCPTCVHEYTDDGLRMCSFYQKPCKLVEECYQFEEFQDYE